MTPTDTALSGSAADAVRTLQAELRNDYSGMRSAEIQLAEAILTAHATTVSGRARLQDIQRQLIEAINNPVAALGTPAGERQFLLFLRGKIAEIQQIVDEGALTDEDHAKLTRALGSGYLLDAPDGEPAPSPTGAATMTSPAAGAMPAAGSALGSLPQAAQGAAGAPAQGVSGLAGAAPQLAGLASELAGRGDAPDPPDDGASRPDTDAEDDPEPDTEEDVADDRVKEPPPPDDGDPASPSDAPAQTRPAISQ